MTNCSTWQAFFMWCKICHVNQNCSTWKCLHTKFSPQTMSATLRQISCLRDSPPQGGPSSTTFLWSFLSLDPSWPLTSTRRFISGVFIGNPISLLILFLLASRSPCPKQTLDSQPLSSCFSAFQVFTNKLYRSIEEMLNCSWVKFLPTMFSSSEHKFTQLHS